ncbi:DnaJ family domain-containing protein, partial [Paenibacillus sp. GCM10012303]|uniref:DnaJ family domain-containing protein n=1 Tax=Paenibacillus sp. GCM10012303 TaxID=3317340 RepID=UPI0036141698
MDEAIEECALNGGLDHLKGNGEPIPIPDGDVLSSVLKQANVLPPWLELQHEIRNDLRAYVSSGRVNPPAPSESADLDAINRKISRYNMNARPDADPAEGPGKTGYGRGAAQAVGVTGEAPP